jgi:hypothetical protein
MAEINKFQNEERDGCRSVLNKHKYANLSNYNSMGNREVTDYKQMSIELVQDKKFDLSQGSLSNNTII